jgi:hypothetical protein
MTAHQPLPPLDRPKPEGLREFSPRAILCGLLVAALMGVSYPYIVLKIGFEPNVSVVAAILGYVLLAPGVRRGVPLPRSLRPWHISDPPDNFRATPAGPRSPDRPVSRPCPARQHSQAPRAAPQARRGASPQPLGRAAGGLQTHLHSPGAVLALGCYVDPEARAACAGVSGEHR